MKLGEIKLEALRIMNAGYENLIPENINIIQNELKYSKYLYRMNESINRALDYIESMEVVDTKIVSLNDIYGESQSEYYICNLKRLADFYSLSRVFILNDRVEEVYFQKIGNALLVERGDKDRMFIEYYPAIEKVEDFSDNNKEIVLDNKFARLIPYFIKYDLFQEDEPELAIIAKSTFESGIEKYRKGVNSFSYNIEKPFGSGV